MNKEYCDGEYFGWQNDMNKNGKINICGSCSDKKECGGWKVKFAEFEYFPLDDLTADFGCMTLKKPRGLRHYSPHCNIHGAMNKVSIHEDKGGFWRCLQGQCKTACVQKIKKR